MGGRALACHARPSGEAAEGGGGADVLDVEGEDDTPPLAPEAERPPPPREHRAPPESPAYGHPGGAGEPAARRERRGAVHEWVEQQLLLQLAGAWEARAISAEAANRDLEARLFRANEDGRAAESRWAEVTKERDRLVTRVKTLERNLGTARKAAGAPAKLPAQTREGAEGAEGPPGERAGRGGGGNAAGVRYPVAGGKGWHAQAEACDGKMSAVSTGLRMGMVATSHQADVDTVAPDAPRVSAAVEDVRWKYLPHRLTSTAMDPSFNEAVVQQSSLGSASRSSAPGGGWVGLGEGLPRKARPTARILPCAA